MRLDVHPWNHRRVHRWSLNFLHCAFHDGRRFRTLNVLGSCIGQAEGTKFLLTASTHWRRGYWAGQGESIWQITARIAFLASGRCGARSGRCRKILRSVSCLPVFACSTDCNQLKNKALK